MKTINRHLYERIHYSRFMPLLSEDSISLVGGFILKTDISGIVPAGTPVVIDMDNMMVDTNITDYEENLPLGILPFDICTIRVLSEPYIVTTMVCIKGEAIACDLPPISKEVAQRLNFVSVRRVIDICRPKMRIYTHYYKFDNGMLK